MTSDEVLVPTRAVNDISKALSDQEIGAVFVQGDIGSGKTTLLSQVDDLCKQIGVDATVVNVSYENASRGSLKPFADALGKEQEKSSDLQFEEIDMPGALSLIKKKAGDRPIIYFTTKTNITDIGHNGEVNFIGALKGDRDKFFETGEIASFVTRKIKNYKEKNPNAIIVLEGTEQMLQEGGSVKKDTIGVVLNMKRNLGDDFVVPVDPAALGEDYERLKDSCMALSPKRTGKTDANFIIAEDTDGGEKEIAYKVFDEVVKNKGGKHLVLTTEAERDLAKRNVNNYRLLIENESGKSYEYSLNRLKFEIEQASVKFVDEGNSVLLLNGFSRLVEKNGFTKAYQYIMSLIQLAQKNNVSIIVPINPKTLTPQEYSLVKRYATVVRKQTTAISEYGPDVKQEQLAKDYIELAAKGKPVIINVDGIDNGGESALNMIINLSSDPRIKIIATYEKELLIEKAKKQIEKNRNVTQTRVGLDKEETGFLIAREISSRTPQQVRVADIDNTFIERIYTQSGGNPLYVKEALRVLLDTKKLNNDIGEWSAADTSIPTKFDEIVTNRIRGANLGSEERKVLEYAATMGSEFDISFVYNAMGTNRETDAGRKLDMEEKIVEAIDSLETNGLLKKSGKKLRVDSHVGRVVYESISPEKRKIIHAKIANALDGDFVLDEITQQELVKHYVKSEQTPEVLGKIIVYASALSDVADVSSEKYMDTAIDAIKAKEEKGMITDEEVKLKFELLQKKQSIIATTRGAKEAIAYNEKAVSEATTQFHAGRVDRTTVARFRLNTGNMKLNNEDYKGAAEEFSRAQAILEVAGDPLGLAKCYTGLGIAYMQLGNDLESDANIKIALDIARKCTEEESKEIETTLYYHSCLNTLKSGKTEDAIGKGMTALQIAKTIPNGVGAIHKYNANIALAKAYDKTKDVDAVLSYLNGAIAVAKEHNYLKLEAKAREAAGKKFLELGKQQPSLVSDGIEELEGALKVYKKIGDSRKIDEISRSLETYEKINSEKPVPRVKRGI